MYFGAYNVGGARIYRQHLRNNDQVTTGFAGCPLRCEKGLNLALRGEGTLIRKRAGTYTIANKEQQKKEQSNSE